MPIYEFYCVDCHRIYSFMARRIDTTSCPPCPKCGRSKLDRQVSAFAVTGKAKGGDNDTNDDMDLPIDEGKMEKAMASLAHEAENVSEDDPRQAAQLMRKFSDMTGLQMGEGMQEALSRMEAGEDPDSIEAELGQRIEEEEPFVMGAKKSSAHATRPPPSRDNTLYDMP